MCIPRFFVTGWVVQQVSTRINQRGNISRFPPIPRTVGCFEARFCRVHCRINGVANTGIYVSTVHTINPLFPFLTIRIRFPHPFSLFLPGFFLTSLVRTHNHKSQLPLFSLATPTLYTPIIPYIFTRLHTTLWNCVKFRAIYRLHFYNDFSLYISRWLYFCHTFFFFFCI